MAKPLSVKRKSWQVEAAKGQKSVDVYRTGVGAITRLRQRIAEVTNNGDDLVNFLHKAMTGQEEDIKGRDRLEAAKLLLDRFYGKAVDVVAVGQLTKEQSAEAFDIAPEDLVSSIRNLKKELAAAEDAELTDEKD